MSIKEYNGWTRATAVRTTLAFLAHFSVFFPMIGIFRSYIYCTYICTHHIYVHLAWIHIQWKHIMLLVFLENKKMRWMEICYIIRECFFRPSLSTRNIVRWKYYKYKHLGFIIIQLDNRLYFLGSIELSLAWPSKAISNNVNNHILLSSCQKWESKDRYFLELFLIVSGWSECYPQLLWGYIMCMQTLLTSLSFCQTEMYIGRGKCK